MGKNQSASGLTNIIQYDNNGNVSFVSGSTTLMQISSSGAITTTGVISGSNALSSSYALNSGLLNGTGSVGFATTGSLLEVSSSQQQISASLLQVSASQQQISSSLLQVSASYTALSGSYNTFSGSASTRTTQIENVYATTGSNSFRADQSITGSLVVSSTITAQTLVVQTVTSSIVYSSGSNIFGSALGDRQTFTGSMNVTGSGTFAGSLTANNLYLTSTGAIYFNEGLSLFPYGGHTYIRPYSASGSINFQNQAGSLLATILDGGNVGIGAVTPAYKLDITNTVPAATSLEPIALRLYNGSDGGSAIYFCNSVSGQSKISFGVEAIGAGTDDTYIALSTGANAAISERMRITSGGNVGINCASPGYTLDVNGLVNINAVADTNQGTVQSLRISSNISNAAVTINACSNNNYGYLTFAQACVAKFEIGVAACSDACYPSVLYINNNTQVGARNAAIRITTAGTVSLQCQLNIGTPGTVSGIKLLVCGGGDYNTLFTSDCNRSGFTIAQPGTSSPVASGLVLAGSCSFRFGTNNFYHLVMNQDGATQVFNTAGIATNTFMPSGLLCTLCGVRFGSGATTLNNYEQGTFTPRLINAAWTSNEGSGNAGWYTRIGNLVTVGGTISWGGGSGTQGNDLRIACLPFVSSNGANERNVGQIGAPGGDSIAYTCSTKGQFVIVSDPNQASMYIIETYQSGTWATYIHRPTVNNAGVIYGFQITYHI